MTTDGLTCLVVDDQERLRRALARQLEAAGYPCAEAGSGVEAVSVLEAREIALVISDIRMPGMDGVALLKVIRERWPDTAVIMVTGVAEVETAVSCLHLGAYDYISKPYQADEVRARIDRALEKRQLLIDNRRYQHHLSELVEQQALRIEELFLEGVQALVHALEAKDSYTHGHSTRVSAYASRIASALGLPPDDVQLVELGAALHDVGKIGVREEVLRKPAKLTDDEYRHIMEHAVIGERILAPLLKNAPGVLAIVRSHHERWDGRGVPDGLAAPRPGAVRWRGSRGVPQGVSRNQGTSHSDPRRHPDSPAGGPRAR
jgi:putative nucleotidyltransferase with HDIG domain